MKKFLEAYLEADENPLIYRTLESLSAQKAYNSLSGEYQKIDYGKFSTALDPIFFHLTEEDLNTVERLLPPYNYIVSYVYQKLGITEEDLESFKASKVKKLFNSDLRKKSKELNEKLTPKEYKKITDSYSKELWYDFRKTLLPLYVIGITETYIQTHNPYAISAWLGGIAPYYALRILADKVANEKISSKLRKAATIYFAARYNIGFLESMVEFGFLAPKLSKVIEVAWPYMPKRLKKALDKADKWLTGYKPKKFDEREIKAELYDVPNTVSNVIEPEVVEMYRQQIEDGLIEIQDPREALPEPFKVGYHKRKIVAEDGKIVDKEFVRKAAQKEGRFLSEVENDIIRYRNLLDYGLGLYKIEGKPVVVRDIIGVVPSKREGVNLGVTRKEGYLALLAKKSDYYMENLRLYDNLFLIFSSNFLGQNNKLFSPSNSFYLSEKAFSE